NSNGSRPMPAAGRGSAGLRASTGETDGDGGSAPRQPAGAACATLPGKAAARSQSRLQVELPSVLRQLPTGVAKRAKLAPRLVQHRIGVVDVQEHSTRTLKPGEPAQAAVLRAYWNMPHLTRGLAASLYSNQLVVAPESAVEKQ